MPSVLTMNALRVVHTHYVTTFRTFPSHLLVFNETPYAESLDGVQILDHAHPILRSIPLVQVIQSVARKTVATKTELDCAPNNLLAVLNLTSTTGLRFICVAPSATGTGIPLPSIRPAESTVHPAGGDQLFGNDVGL